MNEIKRLDKRRVYRAKREIKGIEYRIEEGMLRKEERKRLREGIGIEIMMKREVVRQIEEERERKALDIRKV